MNGRKHIKCESIKDFECILCCVSKLNGKFVHVLGLNIICIRYVCASIENAGACWPVEKREIEIEREREPKTKDEERKKIK